MKLCSTLKIMSLWLLTLKVSISLVIIGHIPKLLGYTVSFITIV